MEISKINVMNPASLMEVPPDEDELEKILSSNETEEIVEETIEESVSEIDEGDEIPKKTAKLLIILL